MNTFALRGFVLGLMLSPLFLVPAWAEARPRDELLRLVPDDAGFCIVVQDLRGHARTLGQAPFLASLKKSPLGLVVGGMSELKQLQEFEKKLQQAFQLDFARIRDDILGDAVVFAFKPALKDDPQKEQDLLLLRARDAKLLADFLERINEIQKDSGDLKEVKVHEHLGRKYVHRVEKVNENFTYLRGPVLVVSSKEQAIKDAIERDQKAADQEPILARKFRDLGADEALAVGWINPRAFDPMLAGAVAEARDAQVVPLKTFQQCWKALDDVALFVTLDKNLSLSLAVKTQAERMPPGIRQFLTETPRPSSAWERFPEDALFAVAGRVNLGAAFEALGEFLAPEDRKTLIDGLERSLGAALGQSVMNDVLPHVGPDWGVCVSEPPQGDKAWFPRIGRLCQVGPGHKTPAVDRALWSTLDSYALLGVLDYNRQNKDQLTLKTVMQGKVEVKYLVNDNQFPAGFQPSYALTDGYLVLASSPDAVRQFSTAKPASVPDKGEIPLARLAPKRMADTSRIIVKP